MLNQTSNMTTPPPGSNEAKRLQQLVLPVFTPSEKAQSIITLFR